MHEISYEILYEMMSEMILPSFHSNQTAVI